MQDGSIASSRGHHLQFLGLQMCQTAFLQVAQISKRKFSKFIQAIGQGQAAPPEDGRSLRGTRDVPKQDHARSFFQFLYDHMAEPLAEGDALEADSDMEFHDEFVYFTRGESAENPVASATGSLESGLPQKCFVQVFK